MGDELTDLLWRGRTGDSERDSDLFEVRGRVVHIILCGILERSAHIG